MSKRKYKRSSGLIWSFLLGLIGLSFIFFVASIASRSLRSNASYWALIQEAPPLTIDKYAPSILKSLIIHPESKDNYFDFILDTGDNNELYYANQINPLAKELIQYFFLGITLPSDDFWCNLNFSQEDSVTSSRLAQTDIGKVLLGADLRLKKDTCRFTDPRHKLGREYWSKLNQRINEAGFSGSQLPIGNRLWIVPGEAIVEEDGDTATIVKASLKVCLEQEYLSYHNSNIQLVSSLSPQQQRLQQLCGEVMQETILDKIEDEVNHSKAYAQLR